MPCSLRCPRYLPASSLPSSSWPSSSLNLTSHRSRDVHGRASMANTHVFLIHISRLKWLPCQVFRTVSCQESRSIVRRVEGRLIERSNVGRFRKLILQAASVRSCEAKVGCKTAEAADSTDVEPNCRSQGRFVTCPASEKQHVALHRYGPRAAQ